MKSEKERKPNQLLREQRLLRGWSLRRVVDGLCVLAAASGEELPGVNVPMVSNWETGTKIPSPFYRERLCKLYNMTADQLGFMDNPTLPVPHRPAPATSSNGYDKAQPIQPTVLATHPLLTPSASVIPREQMQAIDLSSDGVAYAQDEQLSAWLLSGTNYLSMLFDAGCTPEQVVDSVRVILQGVQGLPRISRRKMLELGAYALVNGVPIMQSGWVTESECIRATEALGKSIGDGWKLFHATSTELLFAVAEAQLCMMQQVHGIFYPSVRCAFYSSIYRLKGAALFFLARYREAMKAFDQSYIAGLEANDPWHMAESLSWQGGVWKACGMQDRAIQATEAALRLTFACEEVRSLPLRARLLAHWAESAALLHQPNIMMEKLESSAGLLRRFETSDEYDYATWQQYLATCHFYIGDVVDADRYFEQALAGLKPDWILQKGYTLLLQAQARLKMGEIDRSITSARDSLPFIATINSPLINRGLIDYVQELMRFSDNGSIQSFTEETQRFTFHLKRATPRYLEATI